MEVATLTQMGGIPFHGGEDEPSCSRSKTIYMSLNPPSGHTSPGIAWSTINIKADICFALYYKNLWKTEKCNQIYSMWDPEKQSTAPLITEEPKEGATHKLKFPHILPRLWELREHHKRILNWSLCWIFHVTLVEYLYWCFFIYYYCCIVYC